MLMLNKVLLVGRLTRDPELKYTPSGAAVCGLRLASDRRYVDRNKGETQRETIFIDVTAWGRTGEWCNQYLRKGSALFVEGRLRQERWTDREGKNQDRISIVADRVQFAETRAEAEARARGERDRSAPEEPPAEEGFTESGPAAEPAADPGGDLPF